MLAIECSSLQDALNRLGHVQVRATQRSKERHDPVGEEPEDEVRRVVPGKVVPDQQQSQRREILRQGDADGGPLLPTFPAAPVLPGWEHCWFRQGGQDGRQLGLEPGMEDSVGAAPHPLDPDLATRWMEQGQLLGRPLPHVLMGIPYRVASRVPVGAGIGDRLVRAGLVFGVDGQQVLAICRLDQVFLGEASGSCTTTVPLLRMRTAVPVSHQLRSRSQVSPASRRTHQMV